MSEEQTITSSIGDKILADATNDFVQTASLYEKYLYYACMCSSYIFGCVLDVPFDLRVMQLLHEQIIKTILAEMNCSMVSNCSDMEILLFFVI